MAGKKKVAKKVTKKVAKKAAPKKKVEKVEKAEKPKPVVATIYYRGCSGAPQAVYRVEATEVVEAAGGGLDLKKVPPGAVSRWDFASEKWVAAKLPPVGVADDCVRHTKNVAGIGVPKSTKEGR